MGEREHSDDWQTNSDNDIDALVTNFLRGRLWNT